MSNHHLPEGPENENDSEQANTSRANTESDVAYEASRPDTRFSHSGGPETFPAETSTDSAVAAASMNNDDTAATTENAAVEPVRLRREPQQEKADHAQDLDREETTPSSMEDNNEGAARKLEQPTTSFAGMPFADNETVFVLAGDFVVARQIVTRYDGTCFTAMGPLVATTPDEIEFVLKREDVDERWLVDEFMMETKARGIEVNKSDAARAMRKILNRARLYRRYEVLDPLLRPLTEDETAKAEAEWLRLSGIFEMNGELCIAILQHHIWQVKQKQCNRPVVNHLMPIVFSRMQGSGKTTFAQKFHAPVEELATGPVVLSDFIDTRNADVYRFPVIIVDDVGQIAPKMVPILKSLVTANVIRRRKMGTSDSVGVRQMTTLFGTANTPIEELVPDSTGHRRFVTLPFANGAVDRGGNPEVWKIVMEADYALLWRSVNVLGPTPIAAKLHLLYAHQEALAPVSPLKEWLVALDVNTERVKNITARFGVQAAPLHDLFVADTGSDVSAKSFGAEVKRLLNQPGIPFTDYVRQANGRYYKLRRS